MKNNKTLLLLMMNLTFSSFAIHFSGNSIHSYTTISSVLKNKDETKPQYGSIPKQNYCSAGSRYTALLRQEWNNQSV